MFRALSRFRLTSGYLAPDRRYLSSRLSTKIMDQIFSLESLPIQLPSDLQRVQLLQFPAFKTWIATLQKTLSMQYTDPSHPFHKNPYKLRSINVQSCDYFKGGRLGFVKLSADVRTDDDQTFPGAVFMRGGSVAMMLVLTETDSSGKATGPDEHVILTVQPRIPAGSLNFIELPAGMIDDSGTFSGAAAKEIKEETGLSIAEDELIDMTKLAIGSRSTAEGETLEESHLQQAIYPSPGGCDEFMPIFLARKKMSREEIGDLQGKLTGLRNHGEKITLRICKVMDLWKIGARDGKTLAALALYEGLRREGKI